MDIINLPHNEEAEKCIVGIIMQSPEVFGDIIAEELLAPEDFYSVPLRTIYETMLTMNEHNEPIDFITVFNKINALDAFGGKAVLYLKSIQNAVVTIHNFRQHCQIVKDCALRRAYIAYAEKITKSAADMSVEVENIDTDTDFNKRQDVTSTTAIYDLMLPAYERLTNGNTGQLPGHKTGFPTIDAQTGGLLNGNMIVVAARPGMGKSILGNNIAEFTALHENKPALIFNLEMSKTEIVNRIISSQTGILHQHIKFCKLSGDEYGEIGKFANTLKNKPLFIADEAYVPLAKIRNIARQTKRRYGEIGVIVIDYLQLISSPNSKQSYNRNNEISEISRGIKLLAKELDCPIVVLSQLSRDNERRTEKRPMLSDLRDSGAIEQDADVVMFIHREDYYDKQKANGKAEIIFAKNRGGSIGTVFLSWQPQIMRFMEIGRVEELKKRRENNGQKASK